MLNLTCCCSTFLSEQTYRRVALYVAVFTTTSFTTSIAMKALGIVAAHVSGFGRLGAIGKHTLNFYRLIGLNGRILLRCKESNFDRGQQLCVPSMNFCSVYYFSIFFI